MIGVYGAGEEEKVADKEIARYEAILPHLKDPNVNAMQKLRTLDEYLTNLYNTRLSNLSALRYNVGQMQRLDNANIPTEQEMTPTPIVPSGKSKYGNMSNDEILKALTGQ